LGRLTEENVTFKTVLKLDIRGAKISEFKIFEIMEDKSMMNRNMNMMI
jgi:hypothetical protein